MLDIIRTRMGNHHPDELPTHLPEAAVLIPITDDPVSPRMILTQRASHLSSHAGEVAFPGGKSDESDESLVYTALRESREEIGLQPESAQVLGRLNQMASRFGIKVTPYVAIIDRYAELSPSLDELDSIFEVPLDFFLQDDAVSLNPVQWMGGTVHVPSFFYQGYTVWGLTAFVIVDFLKVVFDKNISLQLPNK